MKSVARMALQPGMEIAEDIRNYKNELIFPAGTKIDDTVIAKLARHSIMCVTIMENIDYASTHYEKIHYSESFQRFQTVYYQGMAEYKNMMLNLIEHHGKPDTARLLEIHRQIRSFVDGNATLLDYLYNMMPGEDELTHVHCLNSALIAGVYSDWQGLDNAAREMLILCAYFYDIGKLTLPGELLWKPEKLTPVEFERIKTHTLVGFRLIEDFDLDPHIKKCILMHHERCDGTGYPSRLKLEQIDIYARRIAIIDAYEAMTAPRSYRKSLTPFQVIANFEAAGYNKYDDGLLNPFLKRIADSQIGLPVRLNDESVWEVLLINPFKLSRPTLKRGMECLDLNSRPDLEIIAFN